VVKALLAAGATAFETTGATTMEEQR